MIAKYSRSRGSTDSTLCGPLIGEAVWHHTYERNYNHTYWLKNGCHAVERLWQLGQWLLALTNPRVQWGISGGNARMVKSWLQQSMATVTRAHTMRAFAVLHQTGAYWWSLIIKRQLKDASRTKAGMTLSLINIQRPYSNESHTFSVASTFGLDISATNTTSIKYWHIRAPLR